MEAFTQTLVNEQWIHAHALSMLSIWSVGPFHRQTQASIEGVWSMWNRSDRDVSDVSWLSEFHSSRWTDDNETNLCDNNRNAAVAVVMATASEDPNALSCYFTRATRVELVSSSLVLFAGETLVYTSFIFWSCASLSVQQFFFLSPQLKIFFEVNKDFWSKKILFQCVTPCFLQFFFFCKLTKIANTN